MDLHPCWLLVLEMMVARWNAKSGDPIHTYCIMHLLYNRRNLQCDIRIAQELFPHMSLGDLIRFQDIVSCDYHTSCMRAYVFYQDTQDSESMLKTSDSYKIQMEDADEWMDQKKNSGN